MHKTKIACLLIAVLLQSVVALFLPNYMVLISENQYSIYNSDYDERKTNSAQARARIVRMTVLKLCKAQATTIIVSLNSVL